VKLADAYGIPAVRVERREEVEGAIRQAQETRGPFLIDFVVEKADIVYPMVPAGADLHNMIRRPMPADAGRIGSIDTELGLDKTREA
jgi:acetolactate synthase-1/2/3 large subunit